MTDPQAQQWRLRVAVLNRRFVSTGGGAERYAIALVEELASRHEIHVFAQEIEHKWPGVTYHRLWTPLIKPRWINQIWFAFTSWWATRSGFDIVHSHENTWHGNVQTVHVLPVKYNLFNGLEGTRLALRWMMVLCSPRLVTYLILEELRYWCSDHRRIVVTAPSLRRTMARIYPQTQSALDLVTPGVFSVEGRADKTSQHKARVALNLPLEGRCVLFVANDFEKKGLHALLMALSSLTPDVYLAVIGNPAQVSKFKEVATELFLERRVFFLGSLVDTGSAYRAADCLVHPTLEDTFAMVVLEAMSHGLPVVVSNGRYCGIAELLTSSVNAIILDDPTDAGEIASSLQRLWSDPDLRYRLSHNASELARHYQWSKIAVQQDCVYQRALHSYGTRA